MRVSSPSSPPAEPGTQAPDEPPSGSTGSAPSELAASTASTPTGQPSLPTSAAAAHGPHASHTSCKPGSPAPARARFTLSEAGNKVRLVALAGATAVTGYVALADPEKGSAYPLCPSRVLLGIDCPFCGGLRGTHDLLNGNIVEALNHNLLLPALLGVMGVMFALWLLPLVGRPARALKPPRWLLNGTIAVLVAFTVTRNLPVEALEFLASDPVP